MPIQDDMGGTGPGGSSTSGTPDGGDAPPGDTAPATTLPPPMTTADPTTTGIGDSDDGVDSSDTFDECGCNFLCDPCADCPDDPNCGEILFECDLWSQDCPEGEKCLAWSNDGGPRWNGSRCSEVAEDPGLAGDPCVVEGNALSGLDSCALGYACIDVDDQTNEGTCAAMCSGNPAEPACPEGTECLVGNGGALILCLPTCSPLLSDCAEGHGCFPNPATGGFVCAEAPTPFYETAGTCAHSGGCSPGSVCVEAELVPGCADKNGCCTEWCDIAAPEDNCAEGTTCEPYPGEIMPGFETLGVCAQ
ncbi:MAG: hypothetical protein AAF721_11015 [Myxococcota bacterium]